MERVRLGVGADFSVLIDYAHTPDALEKLLRTARDSCTDGQRVVLLFGCGGDRDRSKRAMMGSVAELYADRVIVTSDNSRSENPQAIIADILAGMRQGTAEVIPDRAEAIRRIQSNSRRYMRKQLTWFKKDPEIVWFHPDNVKEIINYIDTHLLDK